MEKEKNKCSLSSHSKNEAIIFCPECRIFMCHKCEKSHSELLENHHPYKLDKDIKDIFTGFCKEKNHINELEYFCKTHNKLWCAEWITRIKDEKNGQHSDCNVCIIKDIENDKRNKLKENIKCIEKLSINIPESINELKKIFEKINENKENLKKTIQKIFTKIRNSLNDREDVLLLQVDNKYENLLCNENVIKECEKLPKRIKESLERGKIIEKEWNNNKNKLNELINDCLNIENNIKEINSINENVKKCKSINLNIKFSPKEERINKLIEEINKFGKINYNSFKFKKCPKNISEDRKYEVSGVNKNIITKTGTNACWTGNICEDELDKSKEEYIWKIKILKTQDYDLMVGVATIDFDINSASYETNKNYGWYYYCYNGKLYSGPPHNYQNKYIYLKSRYNEITVIMNMKNRSLKFIIDNEDTGESFTDIPLDKPIFPSVLLYNTNDSVEISSYNNNNN